MKHGIKIKQEIWKEQPEEAIHMTMQILDVLLIVIILNMLTLYTDGHTILGSFSLILFILCLPIRISRWKYEKQQEQENPLKKLIKEDK